ncbi:MAG TPA: hypothetical protein DCX82_15845 [Lachnospiraceae bacterium]|jgi:hypothetical protein|nr:hypothetical protein [Lachnospiraceae bacterium]
MIRITGISFDYDTGSYDAKSYGITFDDSDPEKSDYVNGRFTLDKSEIDIDEIIKNVQKKISSLVQSE